MRGGTRGATAAVVAAFVVLGLPDGALGVAWPSMREAFGRPLADLSWLVIALTAGYLAVTASTGRLARRWGTARLGGGGAAVLGGALLVLALAPAWSVALVAAFLWGCGAGALDAGLNADVALRADARTMGLLHTGYGLGASMGPLLAGSVIAAGASWRPVYGLVAMATVVGVVAGRRLEGQDGPRAAGTAPGRQRREALVGAAAFFLYVCVELGAGHWAFSALTEDEGMATGAASMWVGSYWGAMTLGRLWLGLSGHRRDPRRVLAGSLAGTLTGAGLLTAGLFAGLPLLGASLAAVFPTLVLLTPSRVGGDRAAAAIGWQMAAAGVGGAAGPATVGAVVAWAGIGAYGPTVLVLSGLMAAAVAANIRSSKP